jgi:predicted metal-dependent HD superfamily phosphohydrolase
MNYHALLIKIKDHVNLFYLEHITTNYFYHNQNHTKDVLDAAQKIADHYQLDDRSFFIVCAAACFHDIGFILSKGELHEQKGAELAEAFLKSIEVDEQDIAKIKSCIMATKMPQNPVTMEEIILCDADLFNLGTTSFKEINRLLRKETEALTNTKISGIAWRRSSIHMLENHSYHTDFCQNLLDKTKAENLAKLKARQEEKLAKVQLNIGLENEGRLMPAQTEEDAETIKPEKIKKSDRPKKGIETMFRISASKNVRISEMADNKANIMISVNSIIISVILGLMVKNLESNSNLIVPTILLLVVNVSTIIYSVLATRPKITDGVFTPEQVKNKTVNLLFFGSFYNMNFKEYDEALNAMMKDGEFLYGTLSRDMFWQGKVLGRKYRLLRISYSIFLYGIVAAVLAFAIAIAFF